MAERMVGGEIYAEDVRMGDLIEWRSHGSRIRVTSVERTSKLLLVLLHDTDGRHHVLHHLSKVTLHGTMTVATPLITVCRAVIIGDELLGHIHYDGPDVPDMPPWRVVPAGQCMREERFDSQDQATKWFMKRAETTRP